MTLRTILTSVAGFAVICALWFAHDSDALVSAVSLAAIVAITVCFCVIVCKKRRTFATGAFIPVLIATLSITGNSIRATFPLLDYYGNLSLPNTSANEDLGITTYTVSIPHSDTHRHRTPLAWLACGIIFGLVAQSVLLDERRPEDS